MRELYQQHKMFVRERVNKDERKLVFNALSTLMVISGQRTNKLYNYIKEWLSIYIFLFLFVCSFGGVLIVWSI